jgi:hypothetical protein
MTSGNDDDFTRLDRLIDGAGGDSGRDDKGEAPWVRARAMELVKSADRIRGSSGDIGSADTAPIRLPALPGRIRHRRRRLERQRRWR